MSSLVTRYRKEKKEDYWKTCLEEDHVLSVVVRGHGYPGTFKEEVLVDEEVGQSSTN